MADRAPFEAASQVALVSRGFDHTRSWLPHFSVPPLEEHGEPVEPVEPVRRPVEEDIRGSFLAICELAGYVGLTLGCDPDRPSQAEFAATIAETLEDMARGLRHVLTEPLGRD